MNALKKAAAVAVLLALACGGAFAESSFASMPMYVGGAIGYGTSQADVDWDYTTTIPAVTVNGVVISPEQNIKTSGSYDAAFGHFDIRALFGVMPWASSENIVLKGLALEARIDLGFGGSDGWCDATLIRPGVMAVYSYEFDNGFKGVPYGGLGLSMPIHVLSADDPYDIDGSDIGFTVDLKVGFGWDFTERIRGTVDYTLGFGTGFNQMFAVGCQYFLKK